MSTAMLVTLIIVSAIGAFILFKWLKPYFIKHDTTITFIGGLGTGKTLESVKLDIVLLRKLRLFKWKIYNLWSKFLNKCFIRPHNKRACKKNKKQWQERKLRKKPMLYSNIPIQFKPHFWSKQREWAIMLEEEHLLLLKEITEYSVVFIDEMPQFINQFNWDEELVQKNINEFITFFRHYIGGYFVVTAQSINDIVVQVRRKLNTAIWCTDFRKWLFGLFYTNRMCDVMISDTMETISTSFIEDNTKLHFGLFPPKKTYDTRCYSVRYENVLNEAKKREKWQQLKTYKVLRMQEYDSPLDLETTKDKKLKMEKEALSLSRKAVKEEKKEQKENGKENNNK